MRPLPKKKSHTSETVIAHFQDAESATGMDRAVTQKGRHFRPVAIGSVIALSLLGLAFLYTEVGLNSSQRVVAERIVTGKVSLSSFNETIPVSATVIPENSVFLDTVSGGRVKEVYVEDGATVEEGAPLVALENADLELQVISREAEFGQQLSSLAQAQVNFDQSLLQYQRELMDERLKIDLTRASLERRLPAHETGVALSEIDELRAELEHQEATYALIRRAKDRDAENGRRNLDQLRASVQRIENSLEIVRSSLDQLPLRAPINGRVSALTLQSGQYLAPGSRVAQVDVTGAFKVRAYADEFYLNRLTTGQTAVATVSGEQYKLVVKIIFPSITN